ncbi:aminodeoxychorismate lyase [Simiduia curdlanivorans]|uniref:Aminodeoxychorismate lyase n=1 Tax=Simiduia curdlanivorans TaxID=1492769 RepID=A0ABV8V9R6_9GAMM|nr:aminodeoxychorismate lyase [Simiduia curdlanivorans]MDN3639739.1 aminodeoxychorismate lyase [Simiduia curdlanivorans]
MHKPLVMINGSLCDQISVRDRGLHYGHGLFETLRVEAGQVPLQRRHLARLARDASKLLLHCPEQHCVIAQLNALIEAASREWQEARDRLFATVKILLTAGEGGRGYRSPPRLVPNLIMQIVPRTFTLAQRNSAMVCATRLSNSALAGVKHCNRLEQVLAANELVDTAHFEGIMCGASDLVVEGISSNIFVLKHGEFYTPALDACGVAGVMREFLLEDNVGGLPISIRPVSVDELVLADQLFVANSNWGVVAIDCLHLGDRMVSFNRTSEGEQFIALGDSAFSTKAALPGDTF